MFDLKSRILVVDDMITMRKLVTKICKEIGFTDITAASDGLEAWVAIENAKPPFDLIISDWNMPQCTGIELLKKVRKDERFAKTPFVMVTAEAEKHQIVEAVKEKVSGYVVKPFESESLKEKLEALHAKISGAAS